MSFNIWNACPNFGQSYKSIFFHIFLVQDPKYLLTYYSKLASDIRPQTLYANIH